MFAVNMFYGKNGANPNVILTIGLSLPILLKSITTFIYKSTCNFNSY